MIFSVYKIWIFYDFSGRVSNRHEESYFMSNHTTTSTSLGSRINCTNSNASPVRKSFFQSVSPITTTNILPDGRVERRLETCSYQETEMVSVPHCGKIPIIVQKSKFSKIPFLAGKFKFKCWSRFLSKLNFWTKIEILYQCALLARITIV